jgi:hypothetical protein
VQANITYAQHQAALKQFINLWLFGSDINLKKVICYTYSSERPSQRFSGNNIYFSVAGRMQSVPIVLE